MKIIAAPLQGFTEAPWRRFHAEVYGPGVDIYCAPFVRVEQGRVRPRDLRDSAADAPSTVAQVICRDVNEFTTAVNSLTECGVNRIDLNLGCPFPPQVKHGRGAGLAARPDALGPILKAMENYPEVFFSAKIRLDNHRTVIPMLEQSPVKLLAVHARTAADQYDGETDMESFAEIYSSTSLPLVFNGNVATPDDFSRIASLFPGLEGIMIGQGLHKRPSLASEIATGSTIDPATALIKVLDLHSRLFAHYSYTLCGQAQILAKIKPFWFYLEPLIGHKPAKLIKKSSTIAAYQSAIRTITG